MANKSSFSFMSASSAACWYHFLKGLVTLKLSGTKLCRVSVAESSGFVRVRTAFFISASESIAVEALLDKAFSWYSDYHGINLRKYCNFMRGFLPSSVR